MYFSEISRHLGGSERPKRRSNARVMEGPRSSPPSSAHQRRRCHTNRQPLSVSFFCNACCDQVVMPESANPYSISKFDHSPTPPAFRVLPSEIHIMSSSQVSIPLYVASLRTGLTPHLASQQTYFIEWDAKVELMDADGSRTPKRVPMACTFCRSM